MVDGARDAATAPTARAVVPATPLGDPLHYAAETPILDVAQPERQRFLTGESRELVHERLDGEDVLRRGERAKVRGAQARRLDVQSHLRWEARVRGDRVTA